MSDNMPFEIQVEIMKMLPVKSLIQFRSVSKAWKSLIDNSDFIAHHSVQHTRLQHLLVRSRDLSKHGRYVSIVDDDTFPQQKVSIAIPSLVNSLEYYSIIGCSHGLMCLYGSYGEGHGVHISGTGVAVLWNLSIRKATAVIVPHVAEGLYESVLGFGVCNETVEPKIVKIRQTNSRSEMESIACIPWQVEVFTLSTGDWRSPYSSSNSNLPRKSIQFGRLQVVVGGFLYWLATDRVGMNDGSLFYDLIISFDITNEEFREVKLPDNLARQFEFNLSISKLRESLVVIERSVETNNPVFNVWMMEDHVSESFIKLFTFNINTPEASIRGFWKSGQLVIDIVEDNHGQLAVYEPCSGHIHHLGINGMKFLFSVYPYVETLLLLDQPMFQELNLSY